MLRCAELPQKYHIIAGLDLGTLEKNIINPDNGILDIFGDLVSYHAAGGGGVTLPHLRFQTPGGQKIIYTLGYDNKARWKKAVGGQYGGVYIDEANIADMEFIREVSIRYSYMMMTLNPDDPSLQVYAEYINRCRPLPEWERETPFELLAQLDQPPMPEWVHWYFTFDHNAALTAEKRAQLLTAEAPGTKLYKNKIQGLRGRSTGLVFDLRPEHIITPQKAKEYRYLVFSCGVDTSYSRQSDDTFSFIFTGITTCRKKITLAEQVYNNRDLQTPLSPSDIPQKLIDFLERCRAEWGFSKNVFIDSADQATILECQKYKRFHGSVYVFNAAWKQTKVIDRINFELGWMAHEQSYIVDTCKETIRERNLYSWKEDKDEPEDRNDHTINADQYSWLPYKQKIGVTTETEAKVGHFNGNRVSQ
jgi:PBSX family phage terminase large subunit